MALTGFEISVGGVLSIPVVAGLTFLGFKTWGEKSLDASKYKPKNRDGGMKPHRVAVKPVLIDHFHAGSLSPEESPRRFCSE